MVWDDFLNIGYWKVVGWEWVVWPAYVLRRLRGRGLRVGPTCYVGYGSAQGGMLRLALSTYTMCMCCRGDREIARPWPSEWSHT